MNPGLLYIIDSLMNPEINVTFAEFESGPAVIKVNLANDGQFYIIHRLGISSEIFSAQNE